MRTTFISRTLSAGCFQCNGSLPLWTQKNAQGVAARHHDATGHTTWVDVNMGIRYGDGPCPTERPDCAEGKGSE